MTTAGITIRRRNRSDGIDPLRTHSYAVDREMPRRCAACSTERVRGTTSALVDDGLGVRSSLVRSEGLIASMQRAGRPGLRPGFGVRVAAARSPQQLSAGSVHPRILAAHGISTQRSRVANAGRPRRPVSL